MARHALRLPGRGRQSTLERVAAVSHGVYEKGASGIPLFRGCPEFRAIPLVENHAGGFSKGPTQIFLSTRAI